AAPDPITHNLSVRSNRTLKASKPRTAASPRSSSRARLRGRRAARPRQDSTKDRLVQAALKTLTTEGFYGTTARAIARTGGLNQALIFYHFGSVDQLLLAALDATSQGRLTRYREELATVTSVTELVEAMAALYFGVETVTHLQGDRSRAASLFEAGRRLAPLADAMRTNATWAGQA